MNIGSTVKPKWFNEETVSALTSLSRSTLQKHRFKRVGIPYSKVGRSVRYAEEDVIAFMQERRIDLAS